jgi:hypothetical protein
MSKCKNCCKEFKYQWCLDRHLRRKIPCKEFIYVNPENDTYIPKKYTDIPKNNTMNLVISENDTENDTALSENDTYHLNCKYCLENYSRLDYLKIHMNACKEKNDYVRTVELKLDIHVTLPVNKNECRFCNDIFSRKSSLNRHLNSCKAKQIYREKLEEKLKEKTKSQSAVTNITNNTNNNTINVVNISAETLRKFGEENTDHITNAYLRQIMGRLGVTIPKVVSNVAKKIYCDDSKPENQTIQISNVRSQWAKVSNGNDYELQALGDSVKGVRNKVTDLYVERQCDEPEYFKKINARIDKLDDLNNQNYTAKTLEDKEDQKNASKLKGEIEREIKSTIYNIQKSGNIKKLHSS